MTSVRLRPALADLPVYRPGRTVPGAVKLASNELAFPALPQVRQAIAAAVGVEDAGSGINRYPDNGSRDLTAALAAHCGVAPDRVVTGSGSVTLCQQIVHAVAGEGDEVVFGWRSFESYPIVTRVAGAIPVAVPLTDGHRLDTAALAARVTERTRLVFLCTPNNPTGAVVSRDELDSFLTAIPNDVLVVVDEAYTEFDIDPDSPNGIDYSIAHDNVLSLRTLSKAYGLAGVRVGYAVGHPDLIEAIKKLAAPFAVNSLAQVAAVAALGCVAELRPRWHQVVDERARVTAGLRDAGFRVPTSQGNFVWLPLRERAAAFGEHCEAHGVVVRNFPDAAGGTRVSIGSPAENDVFLAAARSWPER